MMTRRDWGGVSWVDAERPTAKEIRALVDEFNLAPIVGEELSRPSWKPRADRHGEVVHLTLHFPIPRRKKEKTEDTEDEIDFIIGRRFFITARYRHNDALFELLKHADAAALLKTRPSRVTDSVALFASVVTKLYDHLFVDLGENSKRLAEIERDIFKGQEREMVAPLSEAGREILDIKRALSFHKDLLESFAHAALAAFGADEAGHARRLVGELARLEFVVQRNLDLFSSMRETNNSLLNARETATMRVVAVIAFLTLPASIITNFFQMSMRGTPLTTHPNGWLIVTGMSLGLTALLILIAKTKKWF